MSTSHTNENVPINRCCAMVVIRGMNFHRTRQCKKAGRWIEKGQYVCTQHSPEAMRWFNREKKARDDRKMTSYFAHLWSKQNGTKAERKRHGKFAAEMEKDTTFMKKMAALRKLKEKV